MQIDVKENLEVRRKRLIAQLEKSEMDSVKLDKTIKIFQSKSSQQIDSWIDENVKDIDSTKSLLKVLSKAVRALLKK